MKTIAHKFVEYIPENIESGILYISVKYKSAVHNCICGCGNKVITPITPTDWRITFDGQSVSLYPSIGNWNFKCKTHYWIKHGKIKNAPKWDEAEIQFGQDQDTKSKKKYYRKRSFFKFFNL